MTKASFDNRIKKDVSIPDIISAIRRLDGVDHTLVFIELPSGQTLTIAGGPRRFIAEVAESGTDRWCVVDPSSPEGTIDLVAGGQLADFPARVCVDQETVLEAARTFLTSRGKRSPTLTWSQET